jgi:hypothetical protein
MTKHLTEKLTTEICGEYDVIVVGGGVARRLPAMGRRLCSWRNKLFWAAWQQPDISQPIFRSATAWKIRSSAALPRRRSECRKGNHGQTV